MKNVQEILSEIRGLKRVDVMEIQRKLTATREKYEKNEATLEDLEKVHDEFKQAYKDNDKKDNYVKCYENNLRNKLYCDVLPTVIEILNEFVGKKAGEKTKQKIKNAINAKLSKDGLSVWFNSESITIMINEYHNYKIGTFFTIYGKHVIDIDNKIVKDITLDFFTEPRNYIENIEEYLNIQQEVEWGIKEELEKLRNKINAYNRDLPTGFNTIELR